jgi:hypothetical protein
MSRYRKKANGRWRKPQNYQQNLDMAKQVARDRIRSIVANVVKRLGKQ